MTNATDNTTEFKIDTETVTLVRLGQRKWVLQDSEGTIIHTGNTKKGALIYIDSLVSAAKSLAARNKAKLEGAKPAVSKPAVKDANKAKPAAKDAKPAVKDASKPAAKGAKAKPKAVKTDRNLFKFTFGKKVDATIIIGYGKTVWGGLFKLENVHFEKEHYWRGDVVRKDGKRADNIRMDYFCSYCKVPAVLQSDEVITAQKKAIAAAATAAE